ncbi:hypothetical protein Q427_19390 [Halomonas sp. BC04]|nr:hypothetical protein Q427_19390 [Halomonas sp. BC04]
MLTLIETRLWSLSYEQHEKNRTNKQIMKC